MKQNKITHNLKEGNNVNEVLNDFPQLLPFRCGADLDLMAATMGQRVAPRPHYLLLVMLSI